MIAVTPNEKYINKHYKHIILAMLMQVYKTIHKNENVRWLNTWDTLQKYSDFVIPVSPTTYEISHNIRNMGN